MLLEHLCSDSDLWFHCSENVYWRFYLLCIDLEISQTDLFDSSAIKRKTYLENKCGMYFVCKNRFQIYIIAVWKKKNCCSTFSYSFMVWLFSSNFHIYPIFSMNVWDILEFFCLTHFQPIFHFYTPWKHQKTSGFWCFQGV